MRQFAYGRGQGRVHLHQVLLFRLLSCAGSAVHYYLTVPWRAFPVRLFRVLRGTNGDAEEVLRAPSCLRDELSTMVLEAYPSADALLTDAARAVLQTLARFFTMNIATIEARHASTRRLVHASHVQTHIPTLEDVSASWLLRRNIVQRGEFCLVQSDRTEAARKTKGFLNPAGPWRAFVHDRCRTTFSKPGMSALSRDYAALTEQEFAHYDSLGKMGREAARAGHRPFGPARESTPAARLQDHDEAMSSLEAQKSQEMQSLRQANKAATEEHRRYLSILASDTDKQQAQQICSQALEEMPLLANNLYLASRHPVSVDMHLPADELAEALGQFLSRSRSRSRCHCCHCSQHNRLLLLSCTELLRASASVQAALAHARWHKDGRLRVEVDEDWRRKTRLLSEQDCPPASSHRPRWKLSVCAALGFCVCQGTGEQGQRMFKNLVAQMKKFFSKPRKPRKNPTSGEEPRAVRPEEAAADARRHADNQLMKELFVVLKLTPSAPSDLYDAGFSSASAAFSEAMAAEEAGWGGLSDFAREAAESASAPLWFHVGFTNFRTWQMVLQSMREAARRRPVRSLAQCTFLEVKDEPEFGLCAESFAEHVDFRFVWHVSFHVISSGTDRIQEADTVPNWVAVQPREDLGSHVVWSGRLEEEQQKKQARRTRKPGRQRPRAEAGSCSAGQPPRRRHQALGPIPKPVSRPDRAEQDADKAESEDDGGGVGSVDFFRTDDEDEEDGSSVQAADEWVEDVLEERAQSSGASC